MKKIALIGIGMNLDDLTPKQLSLIEQADILIGGKRHLSYFTDHPGEKKPITKDLSVLVAYIKAQMTNRSVVVLASGDPLFYGIGDYLLNTIDSEYIDIYPNISTVATAFARLKEPWHDAYIISLHGRSRQENWLSLISEKDKIALFTDKIRNPAWVARQLIENEIHFFDMAVLEQLGTSYEKIQWLDIHDATEMDFSDPNLVVLKRKPYSSKEKNQERKPFLGMPEHLFEHTSGLITKTEVRVITLSKLRLESEHVLWDLGAGSGSVSIEASLFIKNGAIYAVEKSPERVKQIKANIKRFGVRNIRVLQGEFPDIIENMPSPDRIFIGGGGKGLKEMIRTATRLIKPNGIIVINTVLLSTIEIAKNTLKEAGYETDMVQVQINRSKPMPWSERLESLNPVWIISGHQEN